MDETGGHYAKWNKERQRKTNTAGYHLYVEFYFFKNVEHMETERRKVVAKDQGVEEIGRSR